MSSEFGVRIKADDVLSKFVDALQSLTDSRVRQAEARAINHTGDKAYTAVRRALVKQTSASRALIDASLRKTLASKAGGAATLRYEIEAKGRAITLRQFGAVQFAKGVRAKVWGRLQTYPHTFIVASRQGQVFVRTGKSRLPIRVVFGPKISDELVKDQSKEAFETVAKELAPRLQSELSHLLTVKPS